MALKKNQQRQQQQQQHTVMKIVLHVEEGSAMDLEALRIKLERELISLRLTDAEVKFYKAKEQILHLKRKMGDLRVRYRRAKTDENVPFQQNLRNRIIALKGVIFSYYDYVYLKADEIMKIREEKFNMDNAELIKSGLVSEIRGLRSNSSEIPESNENQTIEMDEG